MQAFMLYMSGGGVQIFSMGIVFMLLFTPFKNIAGMNESAFQTYSWRPIYLTFQSILGFVPFAPSNSRANAFTTLPLQKVVYVLCNLLTLGVGLWKCRSMGLLPTGSGDWLAFETRGLVRSLSLSIVMTCLYSFFFFQGPGNIAFLIHSIPMYLQLILYGK
jgi:hypothetical protein